MHVWLRRSVAIVSMIAGTAFVFGLLYYMNELISAPPPEHKKAKAEMRVEAPKKKKERERPKPQEKRRQPTQTVRAAPMPNISTALSGLSFDLPQFQNDSLVDANKLLGDAGASGKDVIHDAASVDSQPTPRTRVAPEYPAKARQRGIQGHVLLNIRVSDEGRVEQVKVLESEPEGVFENVAVAAVQEWTFEPARYKGHPVTVSVKQRIPFRLN